MTHRPPDKPVLRAIIRPPYRDEEGRKGWFERLSRAQPHVVRRLSLSIPGCTRGTRPLRIAFLADFHTGSHAADIARLAAIVAEAAAEKPDLVLHGGDYVNMQPFGGGRVPPRAVAAVLAQLDAPLGRFAVLGNHDYTYGADEIVAALEAHGIPVLTDECRTLRHEGYEFDLIGINSSAAAPELDLSQKGRHATYRHAGRQVELHVFQGIKQAEKESMYQHVIDLAPKSQPGGAKNAMTFVSGGPRNKRLTIHVDRSEGLKPLKLRAASVEVS